MTPPTVTIARLHAVLRDQYPYLLASRRKAILAHVFGKQSSVLVAHLVVRIQEPPVGWTAAQASLLGRACRTETPRPAA